MSKLSTFLFDLIGLALALSLLYITAYGFGAAVGELVATGDDAGLLCSVAFGFAAIAGACMTYTSAAMLCKPLNRDNLQHIAGLAVGMVNRYTGKRYTKDERGTRWFSTVAANANRDAFDFFPFK